MSIARRFAGAGLMRLVGGRRPSRRRQPPTASAGLTLEVTADAIHVGSRADDSQFWYGDVCEILVIDTNDETKHADTATYFESKYGIDVTP